MRYFVVISCLFLIFSCNKEKQSVDSSVVSEGFTQGMTDMYVDETIFPVINDLRLVFESYYPKAKINIKTFCETEVSNKLLLDSTRLAIIPRELSESETVFFKRKVRPITTPIAKDAVVFVAHKDFNDNNIKLSDFKLSKSSSSDVRLIFDDINSSTVRFMNETVPYVKVDTSTCYFLHDTKKVLDYVANNKQAVGVVSCNWLSQEGLVYNKKHIKTLNVFNKKTSEYISPSQSTIADGSYPFIRTINIINVKGKSGLGKGFAVFAASDIGQRIILKSGLMPIQIPTRQIKINE